MGELTAPGSPTELLSDLVPGTNPERLRALPDGTTPQTDAQKCIATTLSTNLLRYALLKRLSTHLSFIKQNPEKYRGDFQPVISSESGQTGSLITLTSELEMNPDDWWTLKMELTKDVPSV